MNSKLVAGVMIVFLVTGLVGVLLVWDPFPRTYFHIEKQDLYESSYFTLRLSGLEDTNLTISFVDDNSLFYSIDAAPYQSTSAGNAFIMSGVGGLLLHFEALVRMRSINVTLSTGFYCSFEVLGSNLNSSIVYDNGALVDGSVIYQATGNLSFVVTENVTLRNHLVFSGPVNVSAPLSTLYLDIDLPDGIGGFLRPGGPITFLENEGWILSEYNNYVTVAGSPVVDIRVGYCDHVYARLLDGSILP